MREIEVRVDVTEEGALGEPLETTATVVLPDELPESPVVCFGWPGGGYSRRYFTFDMPGSRGGGQAGWHAKRGWVFVACDHPYVGESSHPSDPSRLSYENLAAANRATVDEVLARLAAGSLADGVPAVPDPFMLGIGQSMGGCLLIVQQGQLRTFDAIAVLGYSGSQTVLWMPPGGRGQGSMYRPRGSSAWVIAWAEGVEHVPAMAEDGDGLPGTIPGFHYDDEPRDIVAADMIEYPTRRGKVPTWGSATIPPCAVSMMSLGAVAPEAASITVPVFVGVGERGVCPDPLSEPKAYKQARDVTVFQCQRMSHMHNFATTREVLWARLHGWAESIHQCQRHG